MPKHVMSKKKIIYSFKYIQIMDWRAKTNGLCKKKIFSEDLSPLFPPYITKPLDPCAVTIAVPRRQHPRQRLRGLVPWPIPCMGISQTSATRYRPPMTWPRIVPCESGPRWLLPGTCRRPKRTRCSWPGWRSGSRASSADVPGRTCRGSSSTLHLRAIDGREHRVHVVKNTAYDFRYLAIDIIIRLWFR